MLLLQQQIHRLVPPGCTDTTANNYDASATVDNGSCTYDVTLTVDMNCSGLTPGAVAATGPSDGWSCGTYALSDGDGDGVWEGTFSLAAGSFEYIYCTDAWAQQETSGLIADMQNGGTCAPVTDYSSYANRLITVGAITTTDTWGSCSVCDPSVITGCTDPAADNYNADATSDDGSCTYPPTVLTITTTVCTSASTVQMTGPWWGWDPNAGPAAVDNGDDTWTFTLDPAPTTDMEYLLVVDGVQESLIQSMIDGGSCAPITDYANYANRLWVLNSGDVTNVYGTCGECATGDVPGCTDPAADNYNPNATTDDGTCTYPSLVNITLSVNTANITVGPNGMYAGGGVLGDALAVPLSDPSGTGTWTGVVTLNAGTTGNYIFLNSPANGGDWGTKEDLAGQSCADPANWNDRILPAITSDITLLHCFGSCETDGSCPDLGVSGCTDATANNYDASATTDDGSCTYDVTLTVDMNCSGLTPGAVAATGPSDGWSCGTYALSDGDGDGVWEGTFSLAAGSFEYIYCTDGWAQQETAGLVAEMQNGGTCAPVTDYASYANRLITVGAITTTDTWGSCSVCDPSVITGCTDPAADNYNADATSDDGSCTYPPVILTITTTVCNSASTVQMTGPWWGWDPNAGPAAVDNGDNTWTFTLNPAPTADMEYLLVVDGVQESLIQSMIDGGSCAPITDYANYANRLWVLNSGDVANVYGTCGGCVVLGCMYPNADNYNPLANDDDGSCIFPPTSTCLGDLDGDNVSGTSDLLALLAAFGAVCP